MQRTKNPDFPKTQTKNYVRSTTSSYYFLPYNIKFSHFEDESTPSN